MSLYFGEPGQTTISCVYYSIVLDQYFNVSVPVNVLGPSRTNVSQTCGKMTLLIINGATVTVFTQGVTGNPTDFRLWGALEYGTSGLVWGNWELDKLVDPAFITAEGLTGQWTYAQLQGGSTTVNGSKTSFSGIDGGFPYPSCTLYNADGLNLGTFDDRPGPSWGSLGPGNLPFTVNNGQTFSLYLFYLPPADAAGASVYIPMTLFPWQALGTCGTSDNVNWTQNDSGSGFSSSSTYPWPFPTW